MTRVNAAAAALLTLIALQVVPAMSTKSPTCDEFAHHLANGYSYLVTGDFRMNPASPPMTRMLPALPLIFMGAKSPVDHVSFQTNDSPEFARQFFYVENPGSTTKFVFWSRVPVVLLSLLFGLALFVWTRRRFGDVGGLTALTLYSFSPNILAHAGLATADLAVALFFFLSVASFARYLAVPGARRAAVTGVLTGLTFQSKFSAVLLPPALLLMLLFSGRARAAKVRHAALWALAAFLTIWAGYFFEIKPLLKNTPDPLKKEAMYRKVGGEALLRFAKDVPVPLSTFSSAVVAMGFTRARGVDAFLLGEWSRTGWWYYYFVAFAVKETIPFLLLVLLALASARKLRLDRLTACALFVPIALFFVATLRDHAPAGIRYFLPIFPLLFALGGAAAARLWEKGPAARAAVLSLLVWHAAEAARIHPDYLAYFNEFVAPDKGYTVLRDSNIDWAQDLKGLGEFAVKQGYPEVVLLYHGVEDPRYYKIPYRWPEPDEYETPRATVYALGAHHIDVMRWHDRFKPTAVIGHSIFVYDFRRTDK